MLLWWSCQSPVAHSCGLLKHSNTFHGGLFKLNTKFDADSLLYLLSHSEWDGHTVHMLTQWHLPNPLTSTVKSLLFTHVHSSPLSLAARLHWCCANHFFILTMVGLLPDRPHILKVFNDVQQEHQLARTDASWPRSQGKNLQDHRTQEFTHGCCIVNALGSKWHSAVRFCNYTLGCLVILNFK